MPLRFKIFDSSFVLAPLSCAMAAYLDMPEQVQSKVPLATTDILLAATYGLFCVGLILTYVRGHFAQRRGIQPAPVGKKQPFTEESGAFLFVILIVVGVMWASCVWMNVDGWLHYPTHYRGPISGPNLSSLGSCIWILFMYTRFRFRDSKLD
jgi:hypothetical protein